MSMEGSDKKLRVRLFRFWEGLGAFIGTLGTKRKASSRKL